MADQLAEPQRERRHGEDLAREDNVHVESEAHPVLRPWIIEEGHRLNGADPFCLHADTALPSEPHTDAVEH